MRYEQTKKLSNRQFKRLVGVQQRTFDEMIKVLKDAANLKQTLLLSKEVKLGRPRRKFAYNIGGNTELTSTLLVTGKYQNQRFAV